MYRSVVAAADTAAVVAADTAALAELVTDKPAAGLGEAGADLLEAVELEVVEELVAAPVGSIQGPAFDLPEDSTCHLGRATSLNPEMDYSSQNRHSFLMCLRHQSLSRR
jgi:putative heme iron utilization protein